MGLQQFGASIHVRRKTMKESPVLQHELDDAPSEPAARRRLGATSHAAARRNQPTLVATERAMQIFPVATTA
ncbi:MAG: hypothetical protein ACK501_14555 [Planctomycetota bacterium]